jgi:hypothetical protein
LLIAGTFAISVAAMPVAAADGVGVIAASATTTDRVAVARGVAAAIEGKPRVIADAVDQARTAIAQGAVPITTLRRFRQVQDQIDEGWRAYTRVDFELAQYRLSRARTDAEALVGLVGGATLYADAALRLGAVLGKLGRAPESQAALALALALDPDRPITFTEFSPAVVEAVDAVRAVTPPTRAVHITTEPPGATVSVDGKELGRTPVQATLAIGQHVVIARIPMFQTRAQAVAVDATTSEIGVEVDRDEPEAAVAAGAAPGMPDTAAQLLVDAALLFADLDEVVLAVDTDRRGGSTLLVQRCAGAPARCSAIVEVGYGDRAGLAEAARAAWQDVRAGELRYPPSVFGDPRVTGTPDHGGRCELCRSPWLWGGVGAAVVVGAIVIIAVATTSKPAPIVGLDPNVFTTPAQ